MISFLLWVLVFFIAIGLLKTLWDLFEYLLEVAVETIVKAVKWLSSKT